MFFGKTFIEIFSNFFALNIFSVYVSKKLYLSSQENQQVAGSNQSRFMQSDNSQQVVSSPGFVVRQQVLEFSKKIFFKNFFGIKNNIVRSKKLKKIHNVFWKNFYRNFFEFFVLNIFSVYVSKKLYLNSQENQQVAGSNQSRFMQSDNRSL